MRINRIKPTHSLLILPVLVVLAGMIAACNSPQAKYSRIIKEAESIYRENPDSALSLLYLIEPTDLTVDSLKAKYIYLMASAHDRQGHVMLADSMIGYSVDYYKDKDLPLAIRSATLSALYKLWSGDGKTAIRQLDSLSNLPGVADSLLIYPLTKRAYWATKVHNSDNNRNTIKRLISIDKDSTKHDLYKYWLYCDYLFAGDNDSALVILDALIGNAIAENAASRQSSYEYEKIGVLEEMGNYEESLMMTDKFLNGASENSIEHYIHLWKSLALFNMGDREMAIKELGKADSCASAISDDEKGYYNSFAYALYTVFDFHKTGKLKLIRMAQINNLQKDNLFRIQSVSQEAEQSALMSENKRLILKAKNERQTSIIIIVVLFTLLLSGGLLWFALAKRRKELEATEQAEVLQKLVDELNAAETSVAKNEALRKAMLQQLGIIKMVAETPTAQNREMLRKISSVDTNDGSLVSWENVYEIIDNLYSGFHSKLQKNHGEVLSEKEMQIIVLMMAGFSTKEISVLTNQTSGTIYVRKSAIRKKLGVGEKEDIVAFLREEARD